MTESDGEISPQNTTMPNQSISCKF
jgi:hypothetical protein